MFDIKGFSFVIFFVYTIRHTHNVTQCQLVKNGMFVIFFLTRNSYKQILQIRVVFLKQKKIKTCDYGDIFELEL